MKQSLNCYSEFIPVSRKKEQFIMTFPCEDPDCPVMLFLHGGPGEADSVYAHTFSGEMSKHYTVIYWDQPGAGKTLTRNPGEFPTMNELLNDLFILVMYLKMKYHQSKIVLLGHGFGTILGSLYTLRHPGDVRCCISAGQMVSAVQREKDGFERLQQKIREAGNQEDLERLRQLGTYPAAEDVDSQMEKLPRVRKLQEKYGLEPGFGKRVLTILGSPVFAFSDIGAFLKGSRGNAPVWQFLLRHSMEQESRTYQVPVYYILGEKDPLAEAYFDTIEAPDKKLFRIPGDNRSMMADPAFGEALKEIAGKF